MFLNTGSISQLAELPYCVLNLLTVPQTKNERGLVALGFLDLASPTPSVYSGSMKLSIFPRRSLEHRGKAPFSTSPEGFLRPQHVMAGRLSGCLHAARRRTLRAGLTPLRIAYANQLDTTVDPKCPNCEEYRKP